MPSTRRRRRHEKAGRYDDGQGWRRRGERRPRYPHEIVCIPVRAGSDIDGAEVQDELVALGLLKLEPVRPGDEDNQWRATELYYPTARALPIPQDSAGPAGTASTTTPGPRVR